jgi:hypothetical protein
VVPYLSLVLTPGVMIGAVKTLPVGTRQRVARSEVA